MQGIDKGCDYFYDGDEVACYVDEKRILMKVAMIPYIDKGCAYFHTKMVYLPMPVKKKEVVACVLMEGRCLYAYGR